MGMESAQFEINRGISIAKTMMLAFFGDEKMTMERAVALGHKLAALKKAVSGLYENKADMYSALDKYTVQDIWDFFETECQEKTGKLLVKQLATDQKLLTNGKEASNAIESSQCD